MRLIIAPAKKMVPDRDTLPWRDLPLFLEDTRELLDRLRQMSYGELKALWRCNDAIARLNTERLEQMDLERGLTPAILSYQGIQYQYMAPGVFTNREFDYVQEHLRVLSGFYGLLRPFDGVTPYRLEMQARLALRGEKDLYGFWGDKLARQLFSETDCVLNLASKEYSLCVSRYLTGKERFITCVFGERKGGKILEKGTACKMARGEMVRYLAGRGARSPEEAKDFAQLGYRYAPGESDANTYVFVKEEENHAGSWDDRP